MRVRAGLITTRFYCYADTMKHLTGIIFSVLLAFAAIMAAACSKAAYGAADNFAYQMTGDSISNSTYFESESSVLFRDKAEEDAIEVPSAADNAAQSRKMTKRAEIRLRVEDLDAAGKALSELMEKNDAWSEASVTYDNGFNYTIRVPAPSYDAMLDSIAVLGRVLRRMENAEDVTLRYYDLESRLATRRELLKTYRGYLEKSKNIEEIMIVESRIADLQREIDQAGTQFRSLGNQVDYSVINVEVAGPVAASSYTRPTLGDKMGELFSSFGIVISTLLVVLTGIIIFGIPIILIVVFIYWILFGRVGLLKKLFRLASGKKEKS